MSLEVLRIPKMDPLDGKPGGPGWCHVNAGDGRRLKPLIRCRCGWWCGIGLHSVAADGTVSASFHHTPECDPGRGCGWHAFVTLDGYDGPAFGPGEGAR